MVKFFLEPAVFVFSTALALALALALLFVIMTLLGGGLGEGADVDMDVDVDADIDLDIDSDADIDGDFSPGFLANTLSWLDIGEVPKSVLLIAFLMTFGGVGAIAQGVAYFNGPGFLPPPLIAIFCLAPAVFAVRGIAKGFKKLKLTGETSAVTSDSLIGCTATITLGATSFGKPTHAKVTDQFGRTHYVLVEPVHESDQFDKSTPVVLVARKGPKYFVVGDQAGNLDNIDFTTLETRG